MYLLSDYEKKTRIERERLHLNRENTFVTLKSIFFDKFFIRALHERSFGRVGRLYITRLGTRKTVGDCP